jgi:hypothetical protein
MIGLIDCHFEQFKIIRTKLMNVVPSAVRGCWPWNLRRAQRVRWPNRECPVRPLLDVSTIS